MQTEFEVVLKVRDPNCYIVGKPAAVAKAKASIEELAEKQRKYDEKDAARIAAAAGMADEVASNVAAGASVSSHLLPPGLATDSWSNIVPGGDSGW